MPIVYGCDAGCGYSGPPDTLEELGFGIKRRYCQSCLGDAKEYIHELDRLQEYLAGTFGTRLKEIRAVYFRAHPGGTLPDTTETADDYNGHSHAAGGTLDPAGGDEDGTVSHDGDGALPDAG